jgi:hypothetical protein
MIGTILLVEPSETSQLVNMAKTVKDFWLTHNTPPSPFHFQ